MSEEPKLEESTKTDEPEATVSRDEKPRLRHSESFSSHAASSHRELAVFLLFLLVAGICGLATNASLVPPGTTQQQQDATNKDKPVGKPSNAKEATSPTGQKEGNKVKGATGIPAMDSAMESHIQSDRLRREIAQGRTDVRVITSGDLEMGVPYDAVDEKKLAYVAYPEEEDGEIRIDSVRIADGRISFDMPCGFWIVSNAESDNPAVKTFIRNEELGVTIGVGRGTPDDVTTKQTIERWMEGTSSLAHSGTRYSRESKGGNVNGLVWQYVFDEVRGKRRLVAGLADGSKVYVEVTTEPWPEYERNDKPHVARWIHEFINSIRVLDGTIGDGTK